MCKNNRFLYTHTHLYTHANAHVIPGKKLLNIKLEENSSINLYSFQNAHLAAINPHPFSSYSALLIIAVESRKDELANNDAPL